MGEVPPTNDHSRLLTIAKDLTLRIYKMGNNPYKPECVFKN
jgi:hypothetical protein